MRKHSKSEEGYIALTATIIVVLAMLMLAISVSVSGFYGRFTIFDTELKAMSRKLAEGCVDVGILQYAQADIQGRNINQSDFPIVVSLGEQECDIISISESGGNVNIVVQSVVGDSYTNLEVVVDSGNDYNIISWEELPRL